MPFTQELWFGVRVNRLRVDLDDNGLAIIIIIEIVKVAPGDQGLAFRSQDHTNPLSKKED
jgi:hypothetical protein